MIPEAQALVELAERCEAATGADRNLDGLIYCAINPGATTVVDHEPGRFPRKAIVGPISVVMDRIGGKDGADYLSAPAYTASLDAATGDELAQMIRSKSREIMAAQERAIGVGAPVRRG